MSIDISKLLPFLIFFFLSLSILGQETNEDPLDNLQPTPNVTESQIEPALQSEYSSEELEKINANLLNIAESITSSSNINFFNPGTYAPLFFSLVGIFLGAMLAQRESDKQIQHSTKLLSEQLGHSDRMEAHRRNAEAIKIIQKNSDIQTALIQSIKIFPTIIYLKLEIFCENIKSIKLALQEMFDENGDFSEPAPFEVQSALGIVNNINTPEKIGGLIENIHQYGSLNNEYFSRHLSNTLLYNNLCDLAPIQKELIIHLIKEIDLTIELDLQRQPDIVIKGLNSLLAYAEGLKYDCNNLAHGI